jgi:endonuclease YncB( thermonuclease family)
MIYNDSSSPYFYDNVSLRRVVDGDTIDVTVRRRFDLGFRFSTEGVATVRLRLLNFDTPERGEQGYVECTEHLRSLIEGKHLTFTSYKSDSFDRWLAYLLADGESVHEKMTEYLRVSGFEKPKRT